MALRVATNVQSLVAQRHLGESRRAQQHSLEKMASGSRITKAADDAAGLAISENMRAQVRSIRQANRNASDGISMIQVAEGGLNELTNILVRMRELSIQGASDTLGDTERGFIDKEVQALREEIDRIAKSTEFNGRTLLAGEGDVMEIQVGIRNNGELDRFRFDPSASVATVDALGVGDVSTASKVSSQDNLQMIDEAIAKVSESRASMGALQNRLQSTVRNLEIYDENLSAARSRIYDVDVANETSELTKQNILSSAGVSVLSQANQNPTLALKLI